MRDELHRLYGERLPLLHEARENVENEIQAALRGVHHIDRISVRVKGLESFLDKAFDPDRKEPYTDPLREIEDQLAGRVIVFFLDDIPVVRERLLGTFHRVEFVRKEPAPDAEFGYESEHLVVTIPPQVKAAGWSARDDLPGTMELQLRTIFMHAYAEPQHDLGYKGPDLPRNIKRELAWVAASSWGADKALQRVWTWCRGRPEVAGEEE